VLGGPPAAAAAEAVPGSGFTRAELGPGVTAGIELDAVLPALVDCINTRFGWSALMGANAEASFLTSHVVHQTTMCMHVVEGQLAVSWMLPCQLESADCSRTQVGSNVLLLRMIAGCYCRLDDGGC